MPDNLEANGIPTVIIGSARDIVEHCGVPRFAFSDFPLGNPCGHPWDKDMLTATVRLAPQVRDTAMGPRTTVRSRFAWKAEDRAWRERCNARRRSRGQAPREQSAEYVGSAAQRGALAPLPCDETADPAMEPWIGGVNGARPVAARPYPPTA